MDRQSTLTMICQSAKEIGNTGELIADRWQWCKTLILHQCFTIVLRFLATLGIGLQMKPTFSGVKQV